MTKSVFYKTQYKQINIKACCIKHMANIKLGTYDPHKNILFYSF